MKTQCIAASALIFFTFQLTAFYAMAQANMPIVAYATIKSAKEGKFVGSTSTPGFNGDIAVVYVQYNEDAQKPEKSQMIIKKYPDASSGKLQTALSAHENLPDVEVKMVKLNKGVPQVYQIYRLTNAGVVDIKYVDAIEQVTFNLQKIEITFSAN